MSARAIDVGDKLHIITRRRFESDIRRHFVGEVTEISDGLQEVCGYALVLEPGTNEYRRLPELRTRLFSVAEEGHIVNKLPAEVSIAALGYRLQNKRLVLTDGAKFTLDVHESGAAR